MQLKWSWSSKKISMRVVCKNSKINLVKKWPFLIVISQRFQQLNWSRRRRHRKYLKKSNRNSSNMFTIYRKCIRGNVRFCKKSIWTCSRRIYSKRTSFKDWFLICKENIIEMSIIFVQTMKKTIVSSALELRRKRIRYLSTNKGWNLSYLT